MSATTTTTHTFRLTASRHSLVGVRVMAECPLPGPSRPASPPSTAATHGRQATGACRHACSPGEPDLAQSAARRDPARKRPV